MKIYRGYSDTGDTTPPNLFTVEEDGKVYPLRHVVWHSPGGMSYGYGGSGPADLALSILADHFGEQPTRDQLYHGECKCWAPHQDFKAQVIARFGQGGAWIYPEEKLSFWLELYYEDHPEDRDGWRPIEYGDEDGGDEQAE